MQVKTKKTLLVAILALAAAVLAAGCGGGGGAGSGETGAGGGGELTLADIGWTENTAVANLTKVLLEEDLDYDEVEIQTVDLGIAFTGVAEGDLDAFQDVWEPNHSPQLEEAGDAVEQLDPWFDGQTRFSIAVPTYVQTQDGEEVTSIEQIPNTDIQEIVGIEPGSVIMTAIPENTIPEYGLEAELIEGSTPTMLSEVESRYADEEPFAFIAWSPHWMNEEYDFNYLEDPRETLTNEAGDLLTEPAQLSTVVRQELQGDDPVAYAFLDAFTLTDEQTNELMAVINEAGDPAEGASTWLEDNRDVAEPWLQAARDAQGS